MLPEYKYQCIDRSVLAPILKRWAVIPLSRITPLWIPANMITMSTNLFLYAALPFAVLYGPDLPALFIILPTFMLIYAIGDHMDGLQAKRTNTGSPLGEFCDHYMDVFNTGVMMYLALRMFRIEAAGLVPFIFFAIYAANAAIIFEEYRTGWLHFESLGSLEGVAFIMGLLLLGVHPTIHSLLTTPLFTLPYAGSWKPLELLIVGSAGGGLVTLLASYRRAGGISARFFAYIIASGLLAVYCRTAANTTTTFFLFALHSGHYIGTLMHGHLVSRKEGLPDFVLPVFLLATLFVPLDAARLYQKEIAYAGIAYMALRVLWGTFGTAHALRGFWVWRNPTVES